MKNRTIAAVLAAVAIAISVSLAFAQTGGYGMGPGMMGGYGMGPGMMGGYGMGPGMIGGYGMGPGMMGGYGMGPGMTGGYGANAAGALNFTDDQREKITTIQQGLRSKQWDLMGKVQDEYARRAEAPDDAAASKADDRIAELQQQMFSNADAARKQMDAVLTPEQRKQLRRGGY